MKVEIVLIDKSNTTELALLMAWRSNPIIYQNFFEQKTPLNWDDHILFLTNTKDRFDYIISINSRPIGHVAISKIDQEYPEISIMIGETTLWGKGISSIVLRMFIQDRILDGYNKFSARISNTNNSSISLFLNIGFNYSSRLVEDSNWSLYILNTKFLKDNDEHKI